MNECGTSLLPGDVESLSFGSARATYRQHSPQHVSKSFLLMKIIPVVMEISMAGFGCHGDEKYAN